VVRRTGIFRRVGAGRKKQRYIGRESPDVLDKIRKASESRRAVNADEQRRREPVSMLAAGGMSRESAAVTAVLRILDDAGVFRSGGVLVGTQAFSCYANMLGVRFEAQSLRTADIDVGHDPAILPAWSDEREANVLDSRTSRMSFKVRGRDLPADFLAPGLARDYLLDDSLPAAVVGGSGILVNVPQPARFALHKLWVAGQRPASEQGKVRKDLRQAEQLIEVLKEDRPEDLVVAAKALKPRPSMLRTIRAAARRLDLLHPFPA